MQKESPPTGTDQATPIWHADRDCTAEELKLTELLMTQASDLVRAYQAVTDAKGALYQVQRELRAADELIGHDDPKESPAYGSLYLRDRASASSMRRYRDQLRDAHLRRKAAREQLPKAAALVIENTDKLEPVYKALSATLAPLNLSNYGLYPKQLLAAGLLACRVFSSLSRPETFRELANTAKASVPVESRKAAPAKFWTAGQLKKLAVLLDKAIDLHDKTAEALADATTAVARLDEFRAQEFVEPKRATAEEVGRYLGAIEIWCRKRLPLERDAAEKVLAFRKLLALLCQATRALRKVESKSVYLLQRAIDADTEALVVAARGIHTSLRVQLIDIVGNEDKWKFRSFDASESVPETPEKDVPVIERLQDQAKNTAMAVANKVLAHAHFKTLQGNLRLTDMPQVIQWGGSDLDFEKLFDKAGNFMVVSEETQRANDLAQAEVDAAFDAFQARRDQARQVAKSAAKNATAALGMLAKPLSDDLRVAAAVLYKLKDLHGEWIF